MIAAGEHDKIVAFNPVHQSVLVIDSARPTSNQITSQSFRFTNSLDGRSERFFDQQIDPFEQLPVLLLEPHGRKRRLPPFWQFG